MKKNMSKEVEKRNVTIEPTFSGCNIRFLDEDKYDPPIIFIRTPNKIVLVDMNAVTITQITGR